MPIFDFQCISQMKVQCAVCERWLRKHSWRKLMETHRELSPGKRAMMLHQSSWKKVSKDTRLCPVKWCPAQVINLKCHLILCMAFCNEKLENTWLCPSPTDWANWHFLNIFGHRTQPCGRSSLRLKMRHWPSFFYGPVAYSDSASDSRLLGGLVP